MGVVVSDTSPIRALDYLGRLDLLDVLYGEVWVPPAVAHELLNPRGQPRPIDVGALPIRVQVVMPQDQRLVVSLRNQNLDAGEAEALALAVELRADFVLMDETDGRAAAVALGLVPRGVLGTLVEAKQRGLVSAVTPLLDDLKHGLNFYVSPQLRERALRLSGELPGPPGTP